MRDLDSSKIEKLVRSAVVAVDAAHMKQLLAPSLAAVPPFHEKIVLPEATVDEPAGNNMDTGLRSLSDPSSSATSTRRHFSTDAARLAKMPPRVLSRPKVLPRNLRVPQTANTRTSAVPKPPMSARAFLLRRVARSMRVLVR